MTQRTGNVERRLDPTEPRGEIAIERIAAVTSALDGFDPRLIRVEERGAAHEATKAQRGQTAVRALPRRHVRPEQPAADGEPRLCFAGKLVPLRAH